MGWRTTTTISGVGVASGRMFRRARSPATGGYPEAPERVVLPGPETPGPGQHPRWSSAWPGFEPAGSSSAVRLLKGQVTLGALRKAEGDFTLSPRDQAEVTVIAFVVEPTTHVLAVDLAPDVKRLIATGIGLVEEEHLLGSAVVRLATKPRLVVNEARRFDVRRPPVSRRATPARGRGFWYSTRRPSTARSRPDRPLLGFRPMPVPRR